MGLPLNREPAAAGLAGFAPAFEAAAPLVSVIVTNHNYARYLRTCILKIRDQSYTNIECIVVDDASTDGSGAVLDEIVQAGAFAGNGRSLIVIKSPEKLGQFGAAHAGFHKSSGHYVIFFDSDDYMLPHLVTAHITAFFSSRFAVGVSSVDQFFARHGELVMAGHGGLTHYLNKQSVYAQKICRRTELPFAIATDQCLAELDLAPEHLHYAPPWQTGWLWGSTSALCFRREMLTPLFARVADLNNALDFYLLNGIHPFTGSILIDKPLVVYRIHETNNWTMFPRIENMFNWDIHRHVGHESRVANEIVKSLIFSADFYGKFLFRADNYIRTIESLYSAVWTTKISKPAGFSLSDFLRENETVLRRAFGDETFARWSAPVTQAGRVQGFLHRLGLLEFIYKLLRTCIGDAGISRLRAMLRR